MEKEVEEVNTGDVEQAQKRCRKVKTTASMTTW